MTSSTTDRRLGLTGGAALKVPCRCATTANITLSGFQTIDGVTAASGDYNLRCLVKDQTTAADNGVYDMDSGTWTRALDWDGTYDVVSGTATTASGAFYMAGVGTASFKSPVRATGGIVPQRHAKRRKDQNALIIAIVEELAPLAFERLRRPSDTLH